MTRELYPFLALELSLVTFTSFNLSPLYFVRSFVVFHWPRLVHAIQQLRRASRASTPHLPVQRLVRSGDTTRTVGRLAMSTPQSRRLTFRSWGTGIASDTGELVVLSPRGLCDLWMVKLLSGRLGWSVRIRDLPRCSRRSSPPIPAFLSLPSETAPAALLSPVYIPTGPSQSTPEQTIADHASNQTTRWPRPSPNPSLTPSGE